MNRLRTRRGRRGVALGAIGIVVVLPVVAYFAAPNAKADDSPGANLAGLSANVYATGAQLIPLVKGLVPAGNLSTGDFAQISNPYSASTSETGPSCTATGSPIYPGPVATTLPGALQTEGLPASLAKLTAYPALAQAAFPPTPTAGASGSYAPPGGAAAGVGTAQTKAAEGGCQTQAILTSTALGNGAISIGSTTTNTTTTLAASSVSDAAHADLTHISILGMVDIASITSDSTATSDGSVGKETSALKIGAVTVAGQAAYIGPDGLHLAKTSNDLNGAVGIFNSVLTALQQAGISITTIAPNETAQGSSASVDSGALQIHFLDQSIPNPQGDVPFNAFGDDVDLGLTHADAQATVLPPFTPVQAVTPPSGPTQPQSQPSSNNVSTNLGGRSTTIIMTNNSGDNGSGQQPSTAPLNSSGGSVQNSLPAAQIIGMPTRMAWVVIAVLLSIVACGPLLGYANWQLLRGRKP